MARGGGAGDGRHTFLGRMLLVGILSTAHCLTRDMCHDLGPLLVNASNPLTLLASPSSSHGCRCLVTDPSSEAVVQYTNSLMMRGEINGCGAGLLVNTDTLGYVVCSGSAPAMVRPLTTPLSFLLHKPQHAKIHHVDIHLEVLQGSVEVTCSLEPGLNDSCLCIHDPTPTPRPVAEITPIKNRIIAGFVSAIVFLVCVAIVIAINKFCKRKRKSDAGEVSSGGPVKEAAANPGFTFNERGNHSFLYDEIDPITGRTRIRFEPDPSLNLTPDPSYSTVGALEKKGSSDSGLSSYLREGTGDVEEITPYASTTSTLRHGRSQPVLAGYGDVDPVYPGYTPSYTNISTLPSGYTTQISSVYPSYDLDVDIHHPQRPLSAEELDALYAKPMKRPLPADAHQSSVDTASRSQGDLHEELDVDIPPDVSDRLNESVASVETEV